jgi:SAM-dependent methyltransferase
MINPHFDHNRVTWKNEYSGVYEPVNYSQQFDSEWRLFLERKKGFYQHTGVETDDDWINDRIYDLTGVHNYIHTSNPVSVDRNMGGRMKLDLKFSAEYFRGKRCLDAGCGAGRWTKTLIALGSQVKSIDVSQFGLKSVRRYNDDVECLNLFDIPKRPDLHEAFDFTMCWGVVMCTHDPAQAFENVAMTVRPGGGFYVMVYAPTLHNSPKILSQRKHYHRNLATFEERLAYAYSVADCPENAINYLDMLNTFYNWVVEEETVHGWFKTHGFVDVITLNASEKRPGSFHVYGKKRKYLPALRDDAGAIIERSISYRHERVMALKGPFRKEVGHAWQVPLPGLAGESDTMDDPYRSRLILLEDGKVLWKRHTPHDIIRSEGCGTYSHWCDYLLFSTRDNSSPDTNNRTYEIVLADTSE